METVWIIVFVAALAVGGEARYSGETVGPFDSKGACEAQRELMDRQAVDALNNGQVDGQIRKFGTVCTAVILKHKNPVKPTTQPM